MNRPRAADDFAAIRARMEELRREREGVQASKRDLQLDPLMRRGQIERWFPGEISTGPGRVLKLRFQVSRPIETGPGWLAANRLRTNSARCQRSHLVGWFIVAGSAVAPFWFLGRQHHMSIIPAA